MKKTAFLFLLLCTCVAAYGQSVRVNTGGSVSLDRRGNPEVRSNTTVRSENNGLRRWVFSGNFGFRFGDTYKRFSLSPQIGYAVESWLVVGGGGTYNYYKYDGDGYSRQSVGLNGYVRAYAVQYITFHIQPEVTTSWRHYSDGDTSGKTIAASMLAGAGLTLPIAPGNYMSVIAYYDLLQNVNSPYGSKIFWSVGYGFRF